ncbi:hypothetical protein B0H16DRAFT_1472382 [Mycena metata]|uniref:Uncharacterized protein n=1 Tax=Mycena metata TaxID=1033252 RepID=A0AAD7HP29_9AGAR|nr:hypothetical protein B0H16DRAFT_1472382 [Mycena metata]
MNMSQTGYKLRKHIAKALQTRSKTIRAALARYNTAASALDPPRRHVTWEEVIDFTFLADFNILRDPEGISELRPWATPAARQLMDTHFKILRAKEEIIRLNVEIHCFVTYMQDEREYLMKKEAEVALTDPYLAFFIRQYRWRRGRFDEGHMKRFQAMKKRLGPRFTGTLLPGVRREPAARETPLTPMEGQQDLFDQAEAEAIAREIKKHRGGSGSDESENEDSDEGEDAEEERLAETLETVMVIATDKDTME